MSMATDDRKRPVVDSDSRSLAEELQALLTPLTGEPLDLSLLASANLCSSKKSRVDDPQVQATLEEARHDQLKLLEAHIGPYDEVLGHALRHVKNLADDEIFCRDTGSTSVSHERYEHPFGNLFKGPRPDPIVWIGLFLGTAREAQVRQQHEVDVEEGTDAVFYLENVLPALRDEVPQLPVLELTKNVLDYLNQEAFRLEQDPVYLLRFCATYGLSGVMLNVLAGKYGPVGGVTIDSPLPIKAKDAPVESMSGCPANIDLPAYAFGVALGYQNVVRNSIQQLGARFDAPYLLRLSRGTISEIDTLPTDMMLWAIRSNQPEMVKCLVSEFDFQFRWVYEHMSVLFKFLFHIDRACDEVGVWRSPDYDPQLYEYERREQRKYRSHCCFKEKQEMLKTMIELGLPRNLLIPDLDLLRDNHLFANARAQGREDPTEQEWEAFENSLSRLERTGRERILSSLTQFNVYREDGNELNYVQYYEQIIGDLWKDQPTVQQTRLSEFEALDPRWKRFQEEGETAFEPWWLTDEDDW